MATTYLQAGYWSDSITLFEHALDVTDNNYIAHHKLGEALEAEGKTDAAIRHYSETLRIRPDFVSTYLNLGVALRGQGKFNKAIDQFSKILRLKPDYAVAHKEIGITLEEQGDFAGAIRHYLKALEIRPDYAKVHNKLGIILARQGKIEDAIFHYRKALQFSPNMKQALYNLSWVTATHENEEIRNGQEAVLLAEKLCKITQYNQPVALDALAAAYAESGRFDAAVSTSRKGLKLALQQGNKELALGLKKRLELYKAGSPYRQQTHGK